MDHQARKYFVDALYADMTSSSVSVKARSDNEYTNNMSFVYGDTNLDLLFEVLEFLQPKPGDVFYDLGCGGGQVVFYAALAYPFAKCCGIEYLKDLYDFALSRQKRFNFNLANITTSIEHKLPEIVFVNNDFTQVDLSDANIIFTYSTCFDDELMKKLAETLEKQLKPGSKVVTITKPLPSSQFNLLKRGYVADVPFTVHCYEKI